MASRYRGPLQAFRLADRRHKVFDGAGAFQYGGRWSSPGRRVIYAALSYAGAMLEKLMHTGTGGVPKPQVAIEILVPETVEIEEVTAADVPGWDRRDLIASRRYGDGWLREQRTAVLIVPSVVLRHERNALINQDHASFPLITASRPAPVIWDDRLFRRRSSTSR